MVSLEMSARVSLIRPVVRRGLIGFVPRLFQGKLPDLRGELRKVLRRLHKWREKGQISYFVSQNVCTVFRGK